MKTKIKTLTAICILGFVGLLNTSAVAINKSAELVYAEGFPFTSVETRTENITSDLIYNFTGETASNDLEKEAQLFTKWVVDQQEAKFLEKLNTKSEELIEAEELTKWVVDQEEAKFLQKLMNSIEKAEVE